MAVEAQSSHVLSKEKAPVFFAAEIYRCKDEQEIEKVLTDYARYRFSTDFILRVLQDAGSTNLTPQERVHFDKKIQSMQRIKNGLETQKVTHLPRPARAQ
jgi:hypothetical protein